MLRTLESKRWKIPLETLLSLLQKAIRRQDVKVAHAVLSELYVTDYAMATWNRLEIAAIEDFGLAQPRLAEAIRATRRRWEMLYSTDKSDRSAIEMMMRVVQYMACSETSRLVPCAALVGLKHVLNGLAVNVDYPTEVFQEFGECPQVVYCVLNDFVHAMKTLMDESGDTDAALDILLYSTEQIYMREPQRKNEHPSAIDFPGDQRYTEILWDTLGEIALERTQADIGQLRNLYKFYSSKQNSFSDRLILYHVVLCVSKDLLGGDAPLPSFDDVKLPPSCINALFSDDAVSISESASKWVRDEMKPPSVDTHQLLCAFWDRGLYEENPSRSIGNPLFEHAKAFQLELERKYGTEGAKYSKVRSQYRYSNDPMQIGPSTVKKRKKTEHRDPPNLLGRFVITQKSEAVVNSPGGYTRVWYAKFENVNLIGNIPNWYVRVKNANSLIVKGPMSEQSLHSYKLMEELKPLLGLHETLVDTMTVNEGSYIISLDFGTGMPYRTNSDGKVEANDTGVKVISTGEELTGSTMFNVTSILFYRWTFGIESNRFDNIIRIANENKLVSVSDSNIFTRTTDLVRRSLDEKLYEKALACMLFTKSPSRETCSKLVEYVKTRSETHIHFLNLWESHLCSDHVVKIFTENDFDHASSYENIKENLNVLRECISEISGRKTH